MDWYFVGVDLGQVRDPTAIAVLERKESPGDWDPVMFAHWKKVTLSLRLLERVPLGTPYPEVVDRVVQITRAPELAGRCHLAVDGTGVGPPVIDLLRSAKLDCKLMPVTITGGQSESMENGYHRVPKRDLIVGLQVLFQRGGLKIPRGLPDGPALVTELSGMQVHVSLAGNEQIGTWRDGAHDDLVFAVALAYWAAHKMYPKELEGDDRWMRRR